jgi:predicted LPLAT superfamily acyltransferase/glycosyltransferase involved in cell wall biosynthesis
VSEDFRLCAVMPSYNHYLVAGKIVAALQNEELPVFIIDDCSSEPAQSALAALHDPAVGVEVHRLPENRGKGGAVSHGFRLAMESGFTHVLQIDADGQHDLSSLSDLMRLARQHPGALVTGIPIYDASVPLGRAIGRYITHFWVCVETLSLRIRDTMCGFRIYPLGAVRALFEGGASVGQRMDFDIEIMVRLFWRGVPVVDLPVKVTYPADNTSNFDLWRDNVRISWMHTRLFFTMLWQLPGILAHRPPRSEADHHWAGLAERGARWGLNLWALAYRIFGRRGCLAVMSPVVFYFYLTGSVQRRASRDFLTRVWASNGRQHRPGLADGFQHFLSFAGKVVDTFAGWVGGLSTDVVVPAEVADLRLAEQDARGALFIVSHLGNVELARALLDQETRERLLILVHTKHAENFNRMLRDVRPEAAINTWQVTELGPEAAVELKSQIELGKWVVIAGDRVPIGSTGRVAKIPFLGENAPFSHGPYILASLLECPVYTLFCLRDGDRYVLHASKLADRVVLPRKNRDEALAHYAALFAERLAAFAQRYPLQWYNFFDFWNQGAAER